MYFRMIKSKIKRRAGYKKFIKEDYNPLWKSILAFSCFFLLCLPLTAQQVEGKDFWFTFPENYSNDSYSQNIITIVSVTGATGTLIFPKPIPVSFPFSVRPGGYTSISLPIRSNTYYDGTIEQNGFHIISDNSITVYANNYRPASIDGETLLPTNQLGTDYVVMSRIERKNSVFLARATLVATEDNTVATITSSALTTNNNPPGVPWNVTLNAGETYTFAGKAGISNIGYDSLSGTHITATKPLVVIGHSATSMGCGTIDGYMTEMLPTTAWGNRFITAQAVRRDVYKTTSMTDYVEVVAGQTGAVVTFTNAGAAPIIKSLGPYGAALIKNPQVSASDPGEANFIITSTNPIQVTQWMQGGYFCDNVYDTDPEATFIYPEKTWMNNYILGCFENSTTIRSGLAILINDTGSVSPLPAFLLDGSPLSAGGWNTIAGSSYKFKRVPITAGAHRLENTMKVPFGFYQYTLGDAESYMVQGGASDAISAAVPVKLLNISCKATQRGIQLRWSTASELHNDKFTIERSANGVDFIKIASLPGGGNTQQIRNYEYMDDLRGSDTPMTYYYRLRQIDHDGKTSLMPVVLGTWKPFKRLKSLSPNPAQSGIPLTIELGDQDEGSILRLSNLLGQIVYTKVLPAEDHICSLFTDGMLPGIYVLELESREGIERQKLILDP